MIRKALQLGQRALLSCLPHCEQLAYQHWRMHGRWPNLAAPSTFSEHMTARKIQRANDPLFTLTADKFAVRDYVAARVGVDVLTRLYRLFSQPAEISFRDLPSSYVVKPNHGSALVALVPDAHTADLDGLRASCERWFSTRFQHCGEKWYDRIPPRVLVEEFLGDGTPPPDFKFFTFHGKPAMIQVDSDRYGKHTRNLYRPDWSRIDCTLKKPAGPDVPRPSQLDAMLDVASKLAADFDFIRVDLYQVGERVVFGELSHVPGSGHERYSDPAVDRWLGSLI